MSDKEVEAYFEKLKEGLALAEKRMLEDKMLRGEDVLQARSDGTVYSEPASVVYERLYAQSR
ncbi:MAG: hypothetical protein J6M53_00150 [Bacteroidaceae bacterium]|nr:hypothetical protein [Bacteroidaceae bacterium]